MAPHITKMEGKKKVTGRAKQRKKFAKRITFFEANNIEIKGKKGQPNYGAGQKMICG